MKPGASSPVGDGLAKAGAVGKVKKFFKKGKRKEMDAKTNKSKRSGHASGDASGDVASNGEKSGVVVAVKVDGSNGGTKEGAARGVLKGKRKGVSKPRDKMPPVRLPKQPQEISSNWKALMAQLPHSDKKRKRSASESHGASHPKKPRGETAADAKDASDASRDIWFDGVDPADIAAAEGVDVAVVARRMGLATGKEKGAAAGAAGTAVGPQAAAGGAEGAGRSDGDVLVRTSFARLITGHVTEPTKFVAMDCEMVGVGEGGDRSALARCSIVNQHGHVLYDKYVKTIEKVTDYRTDVSGVTKKHMQSAVDFTTVQSEVAELLKGRVLVGHALHNDLAVLFLSHPRKHIRDTSTYKPFRALSRGRAPALKRLASDILKLDIQEGEHDSVIDARVAMALYRHHAKEWEASIREKFLAGGARASAKRAASQDSAPSSKDNPAASGAGVVGGMKAQKSVAQGAAASGTEGMGKKKTEGSVTNQRRRYYNKINQRRR